jgi:excisionase family DNA binding protein
MHNARTYPEGSDDPEGTQRAVQGGLTSMMITTKQVAAMLGLSRSKVYELAGSAKLTSYRFDGVLRFKLCDVEAFVEASRVVRPPALTPKQSPRAVWLKAPPVDGESDLQKQFRALGIKPRTLR